jgi:predicted lipoprotein with Yx(FWY)xxD motif
MKRIAVLVAVIAAAGSLIAMQTAVARTSHAAAAKRASLKLRTTSLGKFIADSQGRTLYEFEKDKNGKSHCSGQCAKFWPPVITSGKPKLGSGLSASKAGTVRRSDGRLQATYGGHPLYRFSLDKKAGQTKGQGNNAFGANWYVVQSSGKKIDND